MIELKSKFFYWQIQYGAGDGAIKIGYVRVNHETRKYKYKLCGHEWQKCGGIDSGVRKILKNLNRDPVHEHGMCLFWPQTYISYWK